MKNNNVGNNFYVRMVQNSKPAGKAFKRKKIKKSASNAQPFVFVNSSIDKSGKVGFGKSSFKSSQNVTPGKICFDSSQNIKAEKASLENSQSTKSGYSKVDNSQDAKFVKSKSDNFPNLKHEGSTKVGSMNIDFKQRNGVQVQGETESNRSSNTKISDVLKSEDCSKNKICYKKNLESSNSNNVKSVNNNNNTVKNTKNKRLKANEFHKSVQSKMSVESVNRKEDTTVNAINPESSIKRKISDLTSASPAQNNKKHRGDELVKSKNNKSCTSSSEVETHSTNFGTLHSNKIKVNNEKSANCASDMQAKSVGEIIVNQNKKRKKKKKKKKASSENANTEEMPYKPVLVVKQTKDISANWKNLKELIAKADKEKTAKKEQPAPKPVMEYVKPQTKFVDRKGRKTNDNSKKGNEDGIKNKPTLKRKKQKFNGQLKKKEIWFDNVDPILLGEEYAVEKDEGDDDTDNEETDNETEVKEEGKSERKTKEKSIDSNTKAVAIDCEMVGVGLNGKESLLARVTIVDQNCKVIYDKYVKPREKVVDYRTEFSGIRPKDVKDGHDFKTVQQEVAKILKGKILVGHGLENDLRVLYLDHPRSRIRDTSRYKPFKSMFRGVTPKLKMLAAKILGHAIQTGEHNSAEDAQAAMRIYTVHRKEWESIKKKSYKMPTKKKGKKERKDESATVE